MGAHLTLCGVRCPSAVLYLRRVATRFDTEPEGFELDLVEWAQELGLGAKGGKHSPMWRTLDPICRFGLASRNVQSWVDGRNIPWLGRVAPQLPRLSCSLLVENRSAPRRTSTSSGMRRNQPLNHRAVSRGFSRRKRYETKNR